MPDAMVLGSASPAETWSEVLRIASEYTLATEVTSRDDVTKELARGNVRVCVEILMQLQQIHRILIANKALMDEPPMIAISVSEADIKRLHAGAEPDALGLFLIGSLASRVGVTLEQAAALFDGSNTGYLAQLLRLGPQHNIRPVFDWVHELYESRELIAELVKTVPAIDDCTGFFRVLGIFLVAPDDAVRVKACTLLAEIAQQVAQEVREGPPPGVHEHDKQQVYPWAAHELSDMLWNFLRSGFGLAAFIKCWTEAGACRPLLAATLGSAASADSGSDLTSWIRVDVQQALPNAVSLMTFMQELLESIDERSLPLGAELGERDLPRHLADFAMHFAEPCHCKPVRQVAVSLLSQLWAVFTTELERDSGLPKQMLLTISKGFRETGSRELQLHSLAACFRLLERFAERHQPFAPFLYKTLIFALIEFHRDESLRSFIVQHMAAALERMPFAPVGVLVLPLVKQITLQGFSELDLAFLHAIAQHQRLGDKEALKLAELAARIAINDEAYSHHAADLLLALVQRFAPSHLMIRFVIGLFEICARLLESPESTPEEAVRKGLRFGTLSAILRLGIPHLNDRLLSGVVTRHEVLHGLLANASKPRKPPRKRAKMHVDTSPPAEGVAPSLGFYSPSPPSDPSLREGSPSGSLDPQVPAGSPLSPLSVASAFEAGSPTSSHSVMAPVPIPQLDEWSAAESASATGHDDEGNSFMPSVHGATSTAEALRAQRKTLLALPSSPVSGANPFAQGQQQQQQPQQQRQVPSPFPGSADEALAVDPSAHPSRRVQNQRQQQQQQQQQHQHQGFGTGLAKARRAQMRQEQKKSANTARQIIERALPRFPGLEHAFAALDVADSGYVDKVTFLRAVNSDEDSVPKRAILACPHSQALRDRKVQEKVRRFKSPRQGAVRKRDLESVLVEHFWAKEKARDQERRPMHGTGRSGSKKTLRSLTTGAQTRASYAALPSAAAEVVQRDIERCRQRRVAVQEAQRAKAEEDRRKRRERRRLLRQKFDRRIRERRARDEGPNSQAHASGPSHNEEVEALTRFEDILRAVFRHAVEPGTGLGVHLGKSFDEMQAQRGLLSVQHWLRLLRTYHLVPNVMNQNEAKAAFHKGKTKPAVDATYDEFVRSLAYCAATVPAFCIEPEPARRVGALLAYLRDSAIRDAPNQVKLDHVDPDQKRIIVSWADLDEVPEYQHIVPEGLGGSEEAGGRQEAVAAALEVIDGILASTFNVHLLIPLPVRSENKRSEVLKVVGENSKDFVPTIPVDTRLYPAMKISGQQEVLRKQRKAKAARTGFGTTLTFDKEERNAPPRVVVSVSEELDESAAAGNGIGGDGVDPSSPGCKSVRVYHPPLSEKEKAFLARVEEKAAESEYLQLRKQEKTEIRRKREEAERRAADLKQREYMQRRREQLRGIGMAQAEKRAALKAKQEAEVAARAEAEREAEERKDKARRARQAQNRKMLEKHIAEKQARAAEEEQQRLAEEKAHKKKVREKFEAVQEKQAQQERTEAALLKVRLEREMNAALTAQKRELHTDRRRIELTAKSKAAGKRAEEQRLAQEVRHEQRRAVQEERRKKAAEKLQQEKEAALAKAREIEEETRRKNEEVQARISEKVKEQERRRSIAKERRKKIDRAVEGFQDVANKELAAVASKLDVDISELKPGVAKLGDVDMAGDEALSPKASNASNSPAREGTTPGDEEINQDQDEEEQKLVEA
ncbi:Hypothetical Protein FCC1311_080452 [Hondaea fermentalgiana]|uniref:Uncharacterized protein n=1 Tax=Hondaea fermentalgiana TaxID=2315210 RepID=A0A2R5GLR7_9STRA|nr:Hypothetical Protein FCC1311_080452 [Hondaea fermentalgiana]|eukprot:GBG31820.1 Hypothetical Protein FCC1311_080452 [Hondaea fermentalgiana]